MSKYQLFSVAGATAVASILCLSACAGISANGTAAGAQSATGNNYVWVSFGDGDPLIKPINCGAQAAATEAGDTIEVRTIGDGFTPALQIPVLRAAAATRPEGVIISPVDQNALQGPIEEVIDRGIPVITSDQEIADPGRLSGQVRLDNYQAGVLAADHMAQLAGGKPVKVAVESFTKGASTAADGEVAGFLDQLAKYPNVQNIATEYGDINTATYISITSNLLARDPDLFGIFTTFGQASDAALSSIAARRADTIVVGGYSSQSPSVVAAVESGRAAIVDFDWYQVGYRSTQMIAAATGSETAQPDVQLSATLTTRDNLDELAEKTAAC